MKSINIGIVGYGTVGHGVVEILYKNSKLIEKNSNVCINLYGIADRRIDKKIDDYISKVPVLTKDPLELVNNSAIDIIVELIGGISDAKHIIIQSINNGKNIVTANKSVLATYGYELFKLADRKNVLMGFEGAVAGGIPIIRVLKEDMCVNDIREIYAILNGTCNYILTQMELQNREFNEILYDAQKAGYAESDPTFDIEGIDSAHKLAIIASIAFNTLVSIKQVYVEGISKVKHIDIELAEELNGKIKLLEIAKKTGKNIEVRVHPTIIPKRYFLADVMDVYNAVYIRTSKVDRTMHYGRGAGGLPTGSAVLADILTISKDMSVCDKKRVPILGYNNSYCEEPNICDVNEIISTFYLRFTVEDRPSVLSKITGILGENSISIVSVIQRGEWLKGDIIPLVLITHEAIGKNIFKSIERIDNLPFVRDKTLIMRVER
jgi:homoserine dehydrogenase